MKMLPNFNRLTFLFFLIAFSFTFSKCSDTCEQTYRYVYYEPYYSTSAQIKAAVSLTTPKPLSEVGKIYFKDGYLFINEVGKGIHIIDNRIPSQPTAISFLTIPGNYDLAIRGTTLYADSYIDLVAFDITDITKIHEVNRIQNLFNNYTTLGMMVSSEKGILTEWRKSENVQVTKSECNTMQQTWGGIYYESGIAFRSDMAGLFNAKAALSPSGVSNTGIGGSMARFTISGDYLYGLDGANMDVVDVSIQTQPIAKKEMALTWDVETLFPYKDKLFAGTRSGMYILDIKVPDQPTLFSQYAHVRSCDPVVVDDNYAYVTLRSGSECEGFTNQLEVIDIGDLANPSLVKVYPMTNPHGLGIDEGTLFICDGDDGLKAFDATDVLKISEKQLAHYKNINAFDVIPYQKVAMVIGKDGLYQYDYSDVKNIKLLSQLPIVQQ
jgi:hypothetical protein